MSAWIGVGLQVKCPLFLSDFHQNLMVLTKCAKTLQRKISWKSVYRFCSCYTRTARRVRAGGYRALPLRFCKARSSSSNGTSRLWSECWTGQAELMQAVISLNPKCSTVFRAQVNVPKSRSHIHFSLSHPSCSSRPHPSSILFLQNTFSVLCVHLSIGQAKGHYASHAI
jgi:hypothetical protein